MKKLKCLLASILICSFLLTCIGLTMKSLINNNITTFGVLFSTMGDPSPIRD